MKIKVNPDCAKVDTSLMKELQGVIKKEEFGIVQKELEELLEKEVVLGQEEVVMEGQFSFTFRMKKLPSSASEVAAFGSEQC